LLRRPGLSTVYVRLRAAGVPVSANTGECRFEIDVRARSQTTIPTDLTRLSQRRRNSLLARARDGQDLGQLHHASLHAGHQHSDLFALAEAPSAPRAVRHSAAIQRAARAAAEDRLQVIEQLLEGCVTAQDAVLRYKLMHFIHRKDFP
jgi:hypothetical protein